MSALDIAAERARYPEVFRPQGRLRWVLLAAVFGYLVYLLWLFDFVRVFTDLPRVWVIVRLMVDWSHFMEWDHAELWRSMLETVAMAYLGSMLAVVFAVPLGFLGARNIIPAGVFHFVTRRLFDGLRGLDQLIWALVFVRAMGLGPIAGILAIAVAETGVLAKLFAEAVESIDRKQVEGITSTGAGFIGRLRYGGAAAGAAGDDQPDSVFDRIQLARGDDPGAGRGRGDRAAAVGTDSDQCLGSGGLCDRADLGLGGGYRYDVAVPAAAADRRGE